MRGCVVIGLAFVCLGVGSAPLRAASLATFIDETTGARIAIPSFATLSTSTRTGRSWHDPGRRLVIDTFRHRDRSLFDLYLTLSHVKGRRITYRTIGPHSFVLRGRDRDAHLFHIEAHDDGEGEVRGLSIVYTPEWGRRNHALILAMIKAFEAFPDRQSVPTAAWGIPEPAVRSCVATYWKYAENWKAVFRKVRFVQDMLDVIAKDPRNVRTFSDAGIGETFRLRAVLVAMRAGLEAARSVRFDILRRRRQGGATSSVQRKTFSDYLLLYCYHLSDRFFATAKNDPVTAAKVCPHIQRKPVKVDGVGYRMRLPESDFGVVRAVGNAGRLVAEFKWLATNRWRERYSFSADVELFLIRNALKKLRALHSRALADARRLGIWWLSGSPSRLVAQRAWRRDRANYCQAYKNAIIAE